MLCNMKLVVLLCGVFFVSVDASEKTAVPAKRYRVDLDEPPQKRWLSVIKNFDQADILSVMDVFAKDNLFELLEDVGNDVERYLPQPYADEIRGIANYFNVSVGNLAITNLGYDIIAFNSSGMNSLFGCTSIVATDNERKVIHGRNLDFGVGDLKDVTFEVEFHRGGIVEFVSTMFLGYVGVLTAEKPGAFSLSSDERDEGRLSENVLAAFERHWPTMLMAREIMMHADDFESAVNMVSKANTISPIYFIVGGIKPGEGAIIVRDRWGAVNVTRMADTPHKWFVLETNYDPWRTPPSKDDRRDAGVHAMTKIGQERINSDSLFEVLSTPPVFNLKTTYTTLMSASDSTVYSSMIRYDHPNDETYY